MSEKNERTVPKMPIWFESRNIGWFKKETYVSQESFYECQMFYESFIERYRRYVSVLIELSSQDKIVSKMALELACSSSKMCREQERFSQARELQEALMEKAEAERGIIAEYESECNGR